MDEGGTETFDVGPNTETLGFAYLFFTYIWPAIIGLIVIALVGGFLFWFLRIAVANPFQAIPIAKTSSQ